MKKKFIYILSGLLFLTGCITNDIPYPVVVPHVDSFDVEGASKVEIDSDKQVITVYFAETTDIRNVQVNSITFREPEASLTEALVGYHDFTRQFKFTVKTYDEYVWTVKGVRDVERYFTVEGQIGASEIDEVNCRVIATVGKRTPVADIKVTSLKLGPKDVTTYSIQMSDMRDFTEGISLEVTAFELTEVWNIYIEQTDASVKITKVNPWTTEAYVSSMGVAGMDNGFMYRALGRQDWEKVADSDIASDGGSFTAHIKGLKPGTAYEVYAFCGEDKTTVHEFETAPATAIPNGSFEYASKVAGSNYYKFYDPDCGFEDGSYMFWGSGNGEGSEGVSGSAGLGIVITHIDTDDKVDGKQSVRAETSQMAGILAAGNLFTGQFAGLVGTSGGKVNFGRPWTVRPKALKLYCKYTTGPMDIIGKSTPPGVNLIKGETYDRADIKVALGYWEARTYGGSKDSPVHIDTTDPSTFVDFNTDKCTIGNGNVTIYHDGYALNGGEKVSDQTDKWIEYTIPINYRDMETLPSHIIISCAASQYGDYFSGCSTSKLWIDKVELVY